MRLSDLREDLTQVEVVEFIGGVYPRRHLTLIASAPGTGKTWLILRHALDIITGDKLTCGDLLNDTSERSPVVVIFCGEAGGGIMAERLRKMGVQDNSPVLPSLSVYTLTNFMRNNVPIHLDSDDGMKVFGNIIAGEKPEVVFIDTLISFRSEDESDQKSTATMLGGLRRIAEDNNCAIVITHHLRKRKARDQALAITQDDIIGTSAFTRLCSIAYVLSPIQFSDSVQFSCVKSWWRKPKPRAFRIAAEDGTITMDEVAQEDDSTFSRKAEEYITSMIRSGTVTVGQLADEVGCSTSVASRVIKHAVEQGVLRLYWHENNVKFFQKTR